MKTESITLDDLDALKEEQGLRILITGKRNTGKSALGREIAQNWGGVYISANTHAQMSALTETVAEEIALGLEQVAETPEELSGWVMSLAENFGLEEILYANPLKLSGGQTQMTLMAANTNMDIPLVAMDEPLAGLDFQAKSRLLYSIKDYPGNIIWISTRPNLGETEFATHILELKNNQPAHRFRPLSLITSHEVEKTLRKRTLQIRNVALSPEAPKRKIFPFRGYKKPEKIIKTGLNAMIRPGRIYAVLGANGSGKSTLLRTVAGLLPTAQGQIIIDDLHPYKIDAQERVEYVSLAAQHPGHHFLTSSVAEELRVGGAKTCPESYRTHLLKVIGLDQKQDQHPQDISIVEQHLLVLATALAARPSCLLVDEPTSRVDQEGISQVIQLLTEYAEMGGSVLLATHDFELLRRMEHTALFMENSDMWSRL